MLSVQSNTVRPINSCNEALLQAVSSLSDMAGGEQQETNRGNSGDKYNTSYYLQHVFVEDSNKPYCIIVVYDRVRDVALMSEIR